MTIAAVHKALHELKGPAGFGNLDSASAMAVMAAYLSFDALIGNTDRHHSNWAIVRWTDRPDVLAPSFDHASSLGFNVGDEVCRERLQTNDQNRTVAAFVRRGRGKFEGSPGLVDLARDAVSVAPAEDQQPVRMLFGALESTDWEDILQRVPPTLMSHDSRRFAGEILRLNHERLLHALDIR